MDQEQFDANRKRITGVAAYANFLMKNPTKVMKELGLDKDDKRTASYIALLMSHSDSFYDSKKNFDE